MLSLRDVLESALVENPDDLATHYAYADYLQEQGDPRGEFIQIQLALEDPQRSEAERRQLQARVKELLQEHQREWLGSLADDLLPPREHPRWTIYRPDPHSEYHFARGWLDSLSLRNPTDLLHRTDLGPLLCLAPEARLLRRLILEYDDGLVESLLASPYLPNVRVFQLGKPISGFYEPSMVVESPLLSELIAKLPRIEELRLFAKGYNAPHLFSLSNLSSLRVLQINYWIDYPLEVLAGNAALSNLTHLLLHPPIEMVPCLDLAGRARRCAVASLAELDASATAPFRPWRCRLHGNCHFWYP